MPPLEDGYEDGYEPDYDDWGDDGYEPDPEPPDDWFYEEPPEGWRPDPVTRRQRLRRRLERLWPRLDDPWRLTLRERIRYRLRRSRQEQPFDDEPPF